MAKKQTDNKETEEKMQALEGQLKRALADYQNLERRVHEDSMAVAFHLKEQVIGKILPVLDSLDQAVLGASENGQDSGWLKGVLMSIKQFRQVLSEEGLIEIDISGNFDPKFHEAVEVREGEDGKILEVVQRGYTLNGKILRPAKVVVGKKGEKQNG